MFGEKEGEERRGEEGQANGFVLAGTDSGLAALGESCSSSGRTQLARAKQNRPSSLKMRCSPLYSYDATGAPGTNQVVLERPPSCCRSPWRGRGATLVVATASPNALELWASAALADAHPRDHTGSWTVQRL